jgi:hypothetical protein
VRYHGYQISVPASWPVYQLAANPDRCVLFNTHAVYLGTPGADESCPARAYGRTEALLIQPAGAVTEPPPQTVLLPANTAALSERATLPAAASSADTAGHVIRVEAPGPGVLVTASYGTNPALIRSILADAVITATDGGARGSTACAATPAAAPAAASAATPADPAAPELAGQTGGGLGFDACTAPSVAAMTDWLASPYRVIGTYLGGVNWACGYGNFTNTWVRQVAAEGWGFIPIWVGLQAPCSTISGVAVIDSSQAAAEGQAEAADAVATARSFGYGVGSPMYFDMEGYNNSNTACGQAVLTFLGAWTQGLHAAGYLSGVYSSAASGISDLAGQFGSTAYPSPDTIWIGHWTGDPALTDTFVPDSDWANNQRLHQYYGGHQETWGGVGVDIDSDVIGGPVAGLPGAHTDSGPSLLAGQDAVAVAPGASAVVRLTLRGTPRTPAAESWHATAPAGLTVRPADGTVVVPPGRTSTITMRIEPSTGTAAGRYDMPVTISTGGKPAAETFELVSVTQPGATLSTAHPVVLYAADQASMAAAAADASALALPADDVTGSFSQAWTDLTGGKYLVLAVGQAAVNALYYNTCGWANPAGEPAGSTPFFYPGEPVTGPPGADAFELADGDTTAGTALLTSQLTHYALAGTLPDYGRPPLGPAQPARTCLGSPDVPVP